MSKPIHVLNGPNLNRLGLAESEPGARATLAQIEVACRAEAGTTPLVFRQSNAEAELIGWIHEAIDSASAIVINPAAFSFTSIAIVDALKMFPGPIVELHIGNIHRGEEVPRGSLVSRVATAVIVGLGPQGYDLAVRALKALQPRGAH